MTLGPILVVDDGACNRFVLCRMLLKLGYEAIEARDGAEGVAMARERRPWLVLMDLCMPGLDGMTAAARIRTEMGQAAPAVVAVTGSITREQHAACADAGFASLLAKPVDFRDLTEMVRRIRP